MKSCFLNSELAEVSKDQCSRQNVLGDGSGQAFWQNRQNFGQNRQSFFINGSVLDNIRPTCLSRLSSKPVITTKGGYDNSASTLKRCAGTSGRPGTSATQASGTNWGAAGLACHSRPSCQ